MRLRGDGSGSGGALADRVPAPVLVLGGIVSVQCGSAFARHLFGLTGAAGTTLLRLGLAAVVLLLVARPDVRSAGRGALLSALAFGVVMSAMNLTFYTAIASTPLGVAVTVEFLGPLVVAIAGARRLAHVGWAVLAGAGVVLLADAGTSGVPASGLGLSALAGAFWAGYILLSKRVGGLLPGTSGLALALAVGTVVVLPFGLSGVVDGVSRDAPVALLGGAGVAMLSSLVPYTLELTALRRLPANVFGVLMSLQPAGAALAGLLILGQALRPVQLVALVLVSVASAGVTLTSRGRRATATPPQAAPLPEPGSAPAAR